MCFQVEKTLDKIKVACTNTSKKIHMCQLSTGPDNERRKVITAENMNSED